MPKSLWKAGLLALCLAMQSPIARAQSEITGEVMYFAGDYDIRDWERCLGQLASIWRIPALYSIVGNKFGGDNTSTFAMPNLPPNRSPGGMLTAEICLTGHYLQKDMSNEAPPIVCGLVRLITYPYWYFSQNWAQCDGRVLQRQDFPKLAALIGPNNANDPDTFRVPNLPAVTDSGNGASLYWVISTQGDDPLSGYVGEVRRWPAAAAIPTDWVACDGSLLQIGMNQILFLIMGTKYGGNGTSTFAVPQLPDEAGLRWIICANGRYPGQY